MKIVSFDQSTTRSGWCLMEDGKLIESGYVDKSKNKDIDNRTFEMANVLCGKIKEFKPDLVVIEGVQNQSNIATVCSLARLQGALMFYCYVKSIKLETLTPSKWRSALQFRIGPKVKRQELKIQSAEFVEKNFGLDSLIEDENEAICIGAAADIIYNTK